jgi:hypothetical protein
MLNLCELRRRLVTAGTLGLALVAASAVATVPTAAAGAPATPGSCKAGALPVPDNVAMSIVTAADPTGAVIFGRSYPDGSFRHQVLRWDGGKVSKVEVPGNDQAIESVNTVGIGVGTTFASDDTPIAFRYDAAATVGAFTILPGGKGAAAHGINAGGVIVGDSAGRAVIWPSPTAAPRVLPLPVGLSGDAVARAVDDDGTVVGMVFTSTKGAIPLAWGPDGTVRVLPMPGGEPEFGTAAYTIRNGWATGIDLDSAGEENGLRWNLRTNQIETVPGIFIRPSTANASGWMVGTDLDGRAVLFAGDKHVQLPDVFQHEPLTFSNLPETISDDGLTIAGQANDAAGTIHAVIWRCT